MSKSRLNADDGATYSLGQGGFDIIPATGGSPAIAGAGNYTHVEEWIGIEAIDGNVEIEAKDQVATEGNGSHHTLDGTVPNDDQFITLSHDASTLGRFTEIRVGADSVGVVKAYHGPKSNF